MMLIKCIHSGKNVYITPQIGCVINVIFRVIEILVYVILHIDILLVLRFFVITTFFRPDRVRFLIFANGVFVMMQQPIFYDDVQIILIYRGRRDITDGVQLRQALGLVQNPLFPFISFDRVLVFDLLQ